MGWPPGWRYVAGLGLLAAAMGFGVWMVLQLNMPYGNGVRVEPTAFLDALVRYRSL